MELTSCYPIGQMSFVSNGLLLASSATHTHTYQHVQFCSWRGEGGERNAILKLEPNFMRLAFCFICIRL
jgi:hypothetical protein